MFFWSFLDFGFSYCPVDRKNYLFARWSFDVNNGDWCVTDLWLVLALRQSEQRLTLPDQANATMLLVIQPDEFRIEKGQIQFRGHLSDGRVIQGQYFSKEKENLQRFKFDKTTSVLVTGELGRPLPATNAAEFDYRRYLAKNGVYNTIKVTKLVLKAPVRTLNPFQWWQNKCHELRAQWVTATMQLPATLRLYVQGLFLGWRADDFYETLHAVTDLGLIHLFSISGFHVSWLVNVLSKGLIRLRLTQWIIAWIMLMILPSYFILAGAAPSLFRAVAAAMFGFFSASARMASFVALAVEL